MIKPPILVDVLLHPELSLALSAADWDLLIRQARRANLLGRLAYVLESKGYFQSFPEKPVQHLVSAIQVVVRQNVAIRWEVLSISDALRELDLKVVLLKGAAYLMSDLPAAGGRMFSDVDILVPKDRLGEVEQQLFMHGWQGVNQDDYDQRYYRQWMHEIPPLVHRLRGTSIDVHHNILPETAKIRVRGGDFLKKARQFSDDKLLAVLDPIDMVLHSATHLFHEGEFANGLRDLFDLDSLFRSLGAESEFWDRLVSRAQEVGLVRPLWYAMRYCRKKLDTPFPDVVLLAAEVGKPSRLVVALMDFCMFRALMPIHSSCNETGSGIARFLLYIRSHWLRMPMHLLVMHLTRKAFFSSKREQQVLGNGAQAKQI